MFLFTSFNGNIFWRFYQLNKIKPNFKKKFQSIGDIIDAAEDT